MDIVGLMWALKVGWYTIDEVGGELNLSIILCDSNFDGRYEPFMLKTAAMAYLITHYPRPMVCAFSPFLCC